MWRWLSGLAACGWTSDREAEIPSVDLPEVPAAVLRAEPAVELILAPYGLYLDPRGWYAASESEAYRPVGPGLIVELTAWAPARPFEHELAIPLATGVLQALAREGAPPLRLHAPPDAPAALALRVVQSARMAGYPSIDLAVSGAGSVVLRLPVRFDPPCAADAASTGECLFPVITATEAGWVIAAEASRATVARCSPGLAPASDAAWWHHALAPCPAARDLVELGAVLRRLSRALPTCGGFVVPPPNASWQEAIDALAAVRQAGAHPDATLAPPRGEPPPCADARPFSPAGEGSGSSGTPPDPPAR